MKGMDETWYLVGEDGEGDEDDADPEGAPQPALALVDADEAVVRRDPCGSRGLLDKSGVGRDTGETREHVHLIVGRMSVGVVVAESHRFASLKSEVWAAWVAHALSTRPSSRPLSPDARPDFAPQSKNHSSLVNTSIWVRIS